MGTFNLPETQLESMRFWGLLNSAAHNNMPSVPPSTPLKAEDVPVKDEAEAATEVFFRGEHLYMTHAPSARILFFSHRYQFAYVIDPTLRRHLSRLTAFDNQEWEFETGSYIFRLADLTCLMNRLCDMPEYLCAEYDHDRRMMFNSLSYELDRMYAGHLQVELSLSRDIVRGPSEWLQYFYWCHIVDHMQNFKAIIVRVDSFGQISSLGEPKCARVQGARQVNNGIMLTCGWNRSAATVFVPDVQNFNAYGIFFCDDRMLQSPLMRGWAARHAQTITPVEAGDCYWDIKPDT